MTVSAKEWDEAKDAEFTLVPKIDLFEKFCPLKKVEILEYGCAYGRVTDIFFRRGYKNIVGYDTSKGQIEDARKKCPDVHHLLHHYSYQSFDRWREQAGLVPPLPVADNAYDAVVCCAVITCLPKEPAHTSALAEMVRVLKPNGLLYMAEFLRPAERVDSDDGIFFSEKFKMLMKHYSKKELRSLLATLAPVHFEESIERSSSGKRLDAYHCFVRKPTA